MNVMAGYLREISFEEFELHDDSLRPFGAGCQNGGPRATTPDDTAAGHFVNVRREGRDIIEGETAE
jgi:hypothetical protein